MLLAMREAERAVECAGHFAPPLGDTGPDLQVVRPGETETRNPYVHARLEHLAVRLSDKTQRERVRHTLAAWLGDVGKARATTSAEVKRWLVFHAVDLPESVMPTSMLQCLVCFDSKSWIDLLMITWWCWSPALSSSLSIATAIEP